MAHRNHFKLIDQPLKTADDWEIYHMANKKHFKLLRRGSDVWNKWRRLGNLEKPNLCGTSFKYASLAYVDLSEALLSEANFSSADLHGAILSEAYLPKAILNGTILTDADLSSASLHRASLHETNFSHANLHGADLIEAILVEANLSSAILTNADLTNANLHRADLSHADLSSANLRFAVLSEADLSHADLSSANLTNADLNGANLYRANLQGANLTRTNLVQTNLTETTLKDCLIYGISAWDVQLDGAEQLNLTITPDYQSTITVDNLKIAQFIYLLLNNQEIRDVINTLTTKSVLILGRFTPKRKAILDALREALRQHNYLPILFDFEKPASRDLTETVTTLARLSRFIIADLTDPRSIPQELAFIVPHLPSVPVQPLILSSQREYSMFEHFTRFPWVLPIYRYTDEASLLQSLQEKVITPAEQKAKELEKR